MLTRKGCEREDKIDFSFITECTEFFATIFALFISFKAYILLRNLKFTSQTFPKPPLPTIIWNWKKSRLNLEELCFSSATLRLRSETCKALPLDEPLTSMFESSRESRWCTNCRLNDDCPCDLWTLINDFQKRVLTLSSPNSDLNTLIASNL